MLFHRHGNCVQPTSNLSTTVSVQWKYDTVYLLQIILNKRLVLTKLIEHVLGTRFFET